MNPNNSSTTLSSENTLPHVVRDTICQKIYETVDDANKLSDEKYKSAEKLIQEAPDMSTQEKLDAMNKNYERWHYERWNNTIVFTVVALCLLGLAVKGPIAVRVRQKQPFRVRLKSPI